MEHQVLRKDTGGISPEGGWDGGGGGKKGEFFFRVLTGGNGVQVSVTDDRRGRGGLISRLCVHFVWDFGSSGWPISFPRSFRPIALSIFPMTWLLGIALPHS